MYRRFAPLHARFGEHSGAADAPRHPLVSRHTPGKALRSRDDRSDLKEASPEVVLWGVVGIGLCLLGLLIFGLSGFWRGIVIGTVAGFNGGLVLQGLLRSEMGTTTRNSSVTPAHGERLPPV